MPKSETRKRPSGPKGAVDADARVEEILAAARRAIPSRGAHPATG